MVPRRPPWCTFRKRGARPRGRLTKFFPNSPPIFLTHFSFGSPFNPPSVLPPDNNMTLYVLDQKVTLSLDTLSEMSLIQFHQLKGVGYNSQYLLIFCP
jgi:hypothetical protein